MKAHSGMSYDKIMMTTRGDYCPFLRPLYQGLTFRGVSFEDLKLQLV